MPKERPVLFNPEMVRALLAGKKTQSRRAIQTSDPISFLGGVGQEADLTCWGWAFDGPNQHGYSVLARGQNDHHDHGLVSIPCPYGVPGDKLWVRETFEHIGHGPGFGVRTRYIDGAERAWVEPPHASVKNNTWRPTSWRKRPSIHMPRWASRISLELTDVRVSRLQSISEEDAKAEGVKRDTEPCDHIRRSCEEIGCLGPTHKATFCQLWSDLYGNDSWRADPWVWELHFKVSVAEPRFDSV